jgi:hypothetical protein
MINSHPHSHHKNLKLKKPKKRNKNNSSVAGSFVHTFAALYFSPKKYFPMQKERIQIHQNTGFFHEKRDLYFGFYCKHQNSTVQMCKNTQGY